MKNIFCLLFIGTLVLSSCKQGYQKTSNGYEFMVIKSGNGQRPLYGNYIQYHVKQEYIKDGIDTVLADSREFMAQTERFDSMRIPAIYLSSMGEAGAGDSVVIRITTENAIKNAVRLPPLPEMGGYLYTTIKLIRVFDNADLADSAKRAELRINGLKVFNKLKADKEKEIEKNRVLLEADTKTIENYLIGNHIKYVRGNWGSFVVVHEEGRGEPIAYNDVAAVSYTGRTLDSGKVFDSNVDSNFHNPGTYEVTMGAIGSVMPGWTDALFLLKNGSKATVYIPSPLAFGKKGFRPWIKPNDIVVYDMEIKNVITEDRALEIMSENRRKAVGSK